jgi:hypothetical protein
MDCPVFHGEPGRVMCTRARQNPHVDHMTGFWHGTTRDCVISKPGQKIDGCWVFMRATQQDVHYIP